MATSRTPEPQEPLPLSDREQRALADLERHLADDDPALRARLQPEDAPAGGPSSRMLNAIVQVAVVVAVLVVVLPATWAATLVAVLVMVVPVALTVSATRRARSGDGEPRT